MLFVVAFFLFVGASNYFMMGEYATAIGLAFFCAICVAYGIHRVKQKQAQAQAQAQKQTVIVNNYITQPVQPPDATQIVKANIVRTNDDDLPEQ